MHKRLIPLALLLTITSTTVALATPGTERKARYEAAGVPWSQVRKMERVRAKSQYELRDLRAQKKALKQQVAAGTASPEEFRRLKHQLREMRGVTDQRVDAYLTPAQRRKLNRGQSQPATAPMTNQGGVGVQQGGVWSQSGR